MIILNMSEVNLSLLNLAMAAGLQVNSSHMKLVSNNVDEGLLSHVPYIKGLFIIIPYIKRLLSHVPYIKCLLSHVPDIKRLLGNKKVPGENLPVWRQLIFPPLSGNKLRYIQGRVGNWENVNEDEKNCITWPSQEKNAAAQRNKKHLEEKLSARPPETSLIFKYEMIHWRLFDGRSLLGSLLLPKQMIFSVTEKGEGLLPIKY